MSLVYTPEVKMGEPCPQFVLPTTENEEFHSQLLTRSRRPFLVAFICNHCPYVKAIEDRLIDLGNELKKLDIGFIGICSNDAAEYPEDSFIELQKRSREKKYSFPYLHDESQSVAKSFGAVCTPDFFFFDQNAKLAYRGRLDDSWKDPQKVKSQDLLRAAQALASGNKPISEQVPSMGCSIKWKSELR